MIDKNTYHLYYTSDSKFNLMRDRINYRYEVATSDHDDYISVGCNALTSGLSDWIFEGWNSKEKANANMQ